MKMGEKCKIQKQVENRRVREMRQEYFYTVTFL